MLDGEPDLRHDVVSGCNLRVLPDANGPRLGDAHAMRELPVSLRLELDPGTEPISGSLEDAHGKRRTFQGWMEFALALEAFVHAGRSTEADSEHAHAGRAGRDRTP